jgi:hypothetical protein
LITRRSPLKPEDIAVLERISSDLERDGLLAGALGQWHLASEINTALTATRQVIADLEEDTPSGKTANKRGSRVVFLVPQPEETLPAEPGPLLASLLYLTADIESISPPAAELCRTAAELLELEQSRASANLTKAG